MNKKNILKGLIPPSLLKIYKWLLTKRPGYIREWEYMPAGWENPDGDEILGWNVCSVLEAYKSKWPEFLESLQSIKPFGLSPESLEPKNVNLTNHNLIMMFGYVLALSAWKKQSISLLDWGGGFGHYYMIARTLMPELTINYSCKDVPILIEHGNELFPESRFYSDDTCLTQKYDLVFASSAIHYSEDWHAVFNGLAKAAGSYLYITRLPTVTYVPSYVFIQRPYKYGYNTEYLGWCINRAELLRAARDSRMTLVREFITGEAPEIHNAPEACIYRGFLFKPAITDPE